MSDLISRQDTINKAYRLDLSDTGNDEAIYVVDVEEIKKLPSAERKGEWVEDDSPEADYSIYCSKCGEQPLLDADEHIIFSEYCPHCGSYNGGDK